MPEWGKRWLVAIEGNAVWAGGVPRDRISGYPGTCICFQGMASPACIEQRHLAVVTFPRCGYVHHPRGVAKEKTTNQHRSHDG
jgi:hypothetical protein